MQDYTDYIEGYRGLNSLLDRLIKMGDRHTDRQTHTQNLWNLEVLTHLKNFHPAIIGEYPQNFQVFLVMPSWVAVDCDISMVWVETIILFWGQWNLKLWLC